MAGHDVQLLPDVLFELPDINTLCPLGIVYGLGPDSPAETLCFGKQITFHRGIRHGRPIHPGIFETSTVIIVFVEELSAKWYDASTNGYTSLVNIAPRTLRSPYSL